MSRYINPENVAAIRKAIRNGKAQGDFYPAVYAVEPTSICNLQCVVCPNAKMSPGNRGAMNVELFHSVMEDISPYCEFLMLYWMGEPLLHPHLAKLLLYARSRIRGKIILSSNMTCLDDNLAEAILCHADILLCCLDRWDKCAYEKVRHGAHFQSVVSNIEAILAKKKATDRCEIVVKALDMDHDSDEYSRFLAYWEGRGVRPLLAWLNDWAGTLPQIRGKARLPIPLVNAKRSPCADLWFKMVMNWRGDIQMCCFDWNYLHVIGRYGKQDSWLADVWQ